MTSPDAIAICTEVLERKSKSFALAARLLGRSERDAIAVIYAFCRHVDDAIDLTEPADRPRALDQIRREVDDVFAARATGHVVLDAFAVVARAYRIPRTYVDELVAGMTMDVERVRYRTRDELLLYAYRVAGVVGLLLCHVMGLRDARALPRAAHLGIAMQLTNICRDVAEDLDDGRSYLPVAVLGFELEHRPAPGSAAHGAVVHAVERLLEDADRYYESADEGIDALPFSSALAVRAARYVYAAIGDRLLARGGDPFRGRTRVSGLRKLGLVTRALVVTLWRSFRAKGSPHPPSRVLGFAEAMALEPSL